MSKVAVSCKGCGNPLPTRQVSALENPVPGRSEWFRSGYCSFPCFSEHSQERSTLGDKNMMTRRRAATSAQHKPDLGIAESNQDQLYGQTARKLSNSELLEPLTTLTAKFFTEQSDEFMANIEEMLADSMHVLVGKADLGPIQRIEVSFARATLTRANANGLPIGVFAFSSVLGLTQIGPENLARTEDVEGRLFLVHDGQFPVIGPTNKTHQGVVVVIESIGSLLRFIVAEKKEDFEPLLVRNRVPVEERIAKTTDQSTGATRIILRKSANINPQAVCPKCERSISVGATRCWTCDMALSDMPKAEEVDDPKTSVLSQSSGLLQDMSDSEQERSRRLVSKGVFWVLLCENCERQYVLGEDSIIATDENVYSRFHSVAFTNPSRKPDMVGYGVTHPELKGKTEEAIKRIQKDLRNGVLRKWTCQQCRHVNVYPTPDVRVP